MRILLISLQFLLFSTCLIAQHQHTRTCGYDAFLAQKKQDPVWLAKFKDANQKVKQSLQQRTPTCANPEILPVAIHFSGNIDNSNVSCLVSATQAQILALNEDFGGYNTDINTYCGYSSSCASDYAPTALGGGSCIQFCLATENHPAGTGLSNGDPAFTFGQHIWNGNDGNAPGWEGYINIFVSDNVPPGQQSGLLGIAPNSGNDPDANGIWVGSQYFGGHGVNCSSGGPLNSSGSYNLGRTATHEMGHYFNLAHTFDGCGTGPNDGDGISDTPPQDQDSGGNPVLNTANCTVTQNGSPHPNTCGNLPMFMNFMDYSNDFSLIMFTSVQSDVMYAYQQLAGTGNNTAYASSASKCNATNLGMISYSPTYPTGCPANEVPVSAFTTSTTDFDFCPLLNEITFTDQSTGFPTGWAWTFTGAGVSPTSSSDQNPTINVNSTGTLTVTLTASNAAGSDMTPASMNYSITIKSPQDCNDCGMTFTDSGGAGGNYGNNESIEYTLCSNDGEGINLDFANLALAGTFLQDGMRIYDGSTVPTNTNEYLYVLATNGSATGIWRRSSFSSNTYSYDGTTYSTCEQCVSFLFTSDASGTAAGWEATVGCFAVSCSDGVQSPCEEFVDCGGDNCPACPTACEGFQFTDNGGVSGNMSETMSGSYVICGDDASGHAIIDFSTISLGSTQMLIYEGNVASGQAKYLLQNSTLFINTTGNNYSSIPTAPIQSSGQCFTVTHPAAGANTAGFISQVSCCDPGAIYTAASNGGNGFSATVNNLKACTDTDITDATNLTSKDISDSRSCNGNTPEFGYMVFYAIETGQNGTLEVDVQPNSAGGGMDLALYGPVMGTYPNHSGGSYLDCSSGNDPSPVSTTGATAGQIYLAIVATENKGTFVLESTAAATALPVELVSWEATANKNTVNLAWETSSEVNNETFTVYSSDDGYIFDMLTTMKSKSDDGKGAKYSYLDRPEKGGKHYYRLEQRDIDGNVSDLGLRTATTRVANEEFGIFPNPVLNNRLSFTGLSDEETYRLNIFDTRGEVIKSVNYDASKSGYLNIEDIPFGVYFINVSKEGEIFTTKFVKLSE